MPAVTMAPAPNMRREVDCVDGANRDRQVTTYLAGNRVVVLPPPGASALLKPVEARQLAQHLLELAEQAEIEGVERRVVPFRASRFGR